MISEPLIFPPLRSIIAAIAQPDGILTCPSFRGAVEDFHFQFALDVAQLLGGEFIIEDDHAHFALSVFLSHDVLPNFVA